MTNKLVHFNKGAWIQQKFNALAGSFFALGVLFLNCYIATSVNGLVVALAKVLDLACGSR